MCQAVSVKDVAISHTDGIIELMTDQIEDQMLGLS
jgi:hypothetical protein